MPYLPTDIRDGPKSGGVQAQFTRPANTTQAEVFSVTLQVESD